MSLEDVRVFHNDDAGYLACARCGGYVLKAKGARQYMLHDAECSHLTPFTTVEASLTKKPRIWAPRQQDLVDWARSETGSSPTRCRDCM